jgi:hypothetical protein
VFGFRLSCFILREGSVSTPKTGAITQFTRQDEEIGGWNVNEDSGRVANVKRVFVPTGNSADQDKLDGTVGGTKGQKGCETYWTDQGNFDGAGEAVGSSKRRVGTVGKPKRKSRTKASRIPTKDSATQETCLSSIEDPVTQESSDGIMGACGASDCRTEDSGHSGKSEDPKPGTQEDLTKIGQEGRNRKATKPDDAKVPEYIWYDHVFEDGARTWTKAQKKAFPPAARTLQEAMLEFWKKRARRSFLSWLRAKYKDLAELDKEYARCVEHRDGRYYFVELSRNASLKERGKVGLAGYQEWWKGRVTPCTQDLAAGMEALERASWSSWWGWDDGSRPFHWRRPEEYRERIRDGIKVHLQHDPPRYWVPQRDIKDPATKLRVIGKVTKVRLRRYIGPGFVVSLTAFFHVPKGEDDLH